jgi:hypothetical protein
VCIHVLYYNCKDDDDDDDLAPLENDDLMAYDEEQKVKYNNLFPMMFWLFQLIPLPVMLLYSNCTSMSQVIWF